MSDHELEVESKVTDYEAIDDEVEINLRESSAVADRAIVLGAVLRRAFLELSPHEMAEDNDPESERFDLLAWLREEALAEILTEAERQIIEARIGHLDAALAEEASWRTEALAALASTLGLIDALAPYDQTADPGQVLRVLPAPWEQTKTIREKATLLPEAEVASERERAELWYWRAQVADLVSSDPHALAATIQEVARDAVEAGLLETIVNGDFPVRGRPYADHDDDVLVELTMIAAQRLHALNWLCGYGQDWENVPLDV